MNLLKIARVPPVVVSPQDSVKTAVDKMCEVGVGAVAVVKNGDLIGIFTERDLMTRVAQPGLSTLDTPVSKVMTRHPQVAPPQMEASEALEFMTDKHFRHLPIVDENGKLQGILSVRHLMRSIVESISHELESLNAYVSADGPGGD
ncbi:MAG: CBS domain-containing protein [candidate division KSB1 bacterium]|nr:CBS domain-containing protein [candidate division KSB1 bacterium]